MKKDKPIQKVGANDASGEGYVTVTHMDRRTCIDFIREDGQTFGFAMTRKELSELIILLYLFLGENYNE
jgi:hypothetical protein